MVYPYLTDIIYEFLLCVSTVLSTVLNLRVLLTILIRPEIQRFSQIGLAGRPFRRERRFLGPCLWQWQTSCEGNLIPTKIQWCFARAAVRQSISLDVPARKGFPSCYCYRSRATRQTAPYPPTKPPITFPKAFSSPPKLLIVAFRIAGGSSRSKSSGCPARSARTLKNES